MRNKAYAALFALSCGRPMISKGLPEEARANAQFNVARLHSFVQRGYAVVGCEPSCILTFRDEYPDLLKGHEVQAVAQASAPEKGRRSGRSV